MTSERGEMPRSGKDTDALLETVYAELRKVADNRMRAERSDHTLQATALVHEAFLRVRSDKPNGWANRLQFFSAAAEAMRRILVEHARGRGAQKRGGGAERLQLTGLDLADEHNLDSVIALNDALEKLRAEDERSARVVELMFFAGLSSEQTAEILEVSTRTVQRDFEFARAWMLSELG